MALVAYEFDSSDEENEDSESSSCVILNTQSKPPINVDTNTSNEQVDQDTTSLFSTLPKSKQNVNQIVEDKIEDFIPKSKPIKEKQKVKITIPSLSEFTSIDDDDEPQLKKAKQINKGSGLLSLLPPVKGTTLTSKSFVPNSVSQKNKNIPRKSTNTNGLIPKSVYKNAEIKKQVAPLKSVRRKSISTSDADSEDDIELPDTFDDAMWKKVCGRPKAKEIIKDPEENLSVATINIAPEPEKPYEGLDNSAFKELVGKNKRPIGNIKLIDINEEEILLEKDIWMTKALTDPEMEPKKVEEETVDPTRRKRHHITYLAQQAKANEQELKSQWSVSKNSRLQTRAKYGF